MSVIAALLDIVAPERCVGCGVAGEVCCTSCRAGLPFVTVPRCQRCGHPWAVWAPRCPQCPTRVAVSQQACTYENAAAGLVRALKDDGRRIAATVIAQVMVARCTPPPPGVPLVPVPLTASHQRRRGFNQSLLIARALAARWDAPLLDRALQRHGRSPAQRGGSRRERAQQVEGAFATRPGCDLPPEVWLVDDVLTTGATLTACARALAAAGVRRVGAVTFARVLADRIPL